MPHSVLVVLLRATSRSGRQRRGRQNMSARSGRHRRVRDLEGGAEGVHLHLYVVDLRF